MMPPIPTTHVIQTVQLRPVLNKFSSGWAAIPLAACPFLISTAHAVETKRRCDVLNIFSTGRGFCKVHPAAWGNSL
ncbi:MAG: hypothetical protein SGI92_19530 [Bryobacteraceae bacterium]|nr:hypothetical protein [Bryobacteraceae bacterium]